MFYLISDWIYLWMINILDDKCKMIWRYRSPWCVFISNHGLICCRVVIFGRKTGFEAMERESAQYTILRWVYSHFSWTLEWNSLPAVSFRTSLASVCSKHCKHIVAGRTEAWPRRVHRRRTRRTKGKGGVTERERKVESSLRLMDVCVLWLKSQTRDSCLVCCLHLLFLLTFFHLWFAAHWGSCSYSQ